MPLDPARRRVLVVMGSRITSLAFASALAWLCLGCNPTVLCLCGGGNLWEMTISCADGDVVSTEVTVLDVRRHSGVEGCCEPAWSYLWGTPPGSAHVLAVWPGAEPPRPGDRSETWGGPFGDSPLWSMWDSVASPTGRWASTGGTLVLRALDEDRIEWTLEGATRCAMDPEGGVQLEPCAVMDIDIVARRSAHDSEGRSLVEPVNEVSTASGASQYGAASAPLCGPFDGCMTE